MFQVLNLNIVFVFISFNVVSSNTYCLFSVFACMPVCLSLFRQFNASLKNVKTMSVLLEKLFLGPFFHKNLRLPWQPNSCEKVSLVLLLSWQPAVAEYNT